MTGPDLLSYVLAGACGALLVALAWLVVGWRREAREFAAEEARAAEWDRQFRAGHHLPDAPEGDPAGADPEPTR